MSFKLIHFTLGVFIFILGVAMMFPAALDLYDGHGDAFAFLKPGIISLFIGGVLLSTNSGFQGQVTIRETFLLTTFAWFGMGVFASFPFMFSELNLSFPNALFESISGITTTGSTVIVGLDKVSRGILLWRSLLHWIGGIGIVGFGIVLLPFLRIGGMQLFKAESSDSSDKVFSKSGTTMFYLLFVYTLLTALCLITYRFLGMSSFDALNHAMATISTGGFSTHDSSLGFYPDRKIHLAAAFFMICGAIPFYLYLKIIHQRKVDFFKDTQVRAFLFLILILSLIISTYSYMNKIVVNYTHAFIDALFAVTTVITTTGFATTDYLIWGPFAASFFLFLTYIGSCTGSTSGGLKMMRILIALSVLKTQVYKLILPHSVKKPTYEGRTLKTEDVQNVLTFMFLYVIINIIVTLALLATGLDFETSLSGAATAIANVGPGIGKTIGPAGNFSSLSDTAKYILSFAMIMGRLEIMTVLIIFTPYFWKK